VAEFMAKMGDGRSNGGMPITLADIGSTAPDTLAGRYMRRFWHPVYHSHELPIGRAVPIRIMSEDFTLFRGESGKPYVVASRCAHRAMVLHPGWVQGDTIRCFYHGWRYDGQGHCVEQPAEVRPFCDKVSIRACPTREYLGLIFAYLGDGEPGDLPRYPMFEDENLVLNYDSYERACHFFNNLENGPDLSHIAFAHGTAELWDSQADNPAITAKESDWGVTYQAQRPSGKRIISQFAMPNVFYARGVPDDPEVGYREFIAWWVPHDDNRHTQFTIAKKEKGSQVTERYQQRRAERMKREDLDRESIARAILAGKMTWDQVDPKRVNMIFLQDDVAQMGVGNMADRPTERLAQSDIGVAHARHIWMRELGKFGRGEPLKEWCARDDRFVVLAEF